MNTKPNNGGPIAPNMIVSVEPDGKQTMIAVGGLSLHDWFAGMAMQGLLAGDTSQSMSARAIAKLASDQADEMLAARDGKEGA